MRGYVDYINFTALTVHGWALASGEVDNSRTRVIVLLDGVEIGSGLPTAHRSDLARFTSQIAGFAIELTTPVSPLDCLAGRVRAVAAHEDDSAQLPYSTTLEGALRHKAIDLLLGGDPPHPLELAVSPNMTLDAQSASSVSSGSLSPLLVPVGHLSSDKTARAGKGGHLFLTVPSVLHDDDTDCGPMSDRRGKVRQWLDVFAKRAAGCQDRGVVYLQTIIPEKSTALRHLAPVPLAGPSPLLTHLHESLLRQSFYFDALELLDNWDDEWGTAYFEPDTRFSPAGAKHFFLGLIEALAAGGRSDVAAVGLDTVHVRRGDLSDRFGLPIYARSLEPSRDVTAALGSELELVLRRPSPSGAVGSRYTFRNSAAPIDLKVLVFGDAFFQNGDFAHHVSWWAKHFFADFTFVWQSDVDWALVDELAPDVVVGQTIERFLSTVPTA